MNKKIIDVHLVLENNEVICLTGDDIARLNILNVQRNINYGCGNAIISFKADELFFIIYAKANLDSRYSPSSDWYGIKDRKLPFNRLMQYNDIAAIQLNYTDDTTEYIYVNTSLDDNENNFFQSSSIDDIDGNLHILISPKQTVKKYLRDEAFYYFNEEGL